jgi:hypothetical protein
MSTEDEQLGAALKQFFNVPLSDAAPEPPTPPVPAHPPMPDLHQGPRPLAPDEDAETVAAIAQIFPTTRR